MVFFLRFLDFPIFSPDFFKIEFEIFLPFSRLSHRCFSFLWFSLGVF